VKIEVSDEPLEWVAPGRYVYVQVWRFVFVIFIGGRSNR
jgi:hypothetical protein